MSSIMKKKKKRITKKNYVVVTEAGKASLCKGNNEARTAPEERGFLKELEGKRPW